MANKGLKLRMPCPNAFAPPRTAPCPLDAQDENESAPQRQDGTVGHGYMCVLVSVATCWWCRLLFDWFWNFWYGQILLVGGRRCPRRLLLASTGPFPSTDPSLGGFPPGSQIPRAHIFGSLLGGVSRSLCSGTSRSRSLFHGAMCPRPRLPSFGSPCSGMFISRSRFCGSALGLRQPSGKHIELSFVLFRRRFGLTLGPAIRPGLQRIVLCGDGSFSLASKLDASSTLAAVSTTGSALSCSCVSMTEVQPTPCRFSRLHVRPRRSRSSRLPRRTNESSNADAPPDFSRPWVALTLAIGLTDSSTKKAEPCVCRLGRSGRWVSRRLVRVLISGSSGPLCATILCPRSDFSDSLALVGARVCLGDWESGVSATSTGGGVPCGSSKSAPSSSPGIAGAPALMASECCILAASKVVGGGDNNKVSDLAFSCVARWPTPGSCSSTRRSPFRQTRRPSPPTFKSCKTTFDPSPPISLAPRV